MIRHDFLALIAPDADCPPVPEQVELAGSTYDLPVPARVADFLHELLGNKGVFTCLDDYCTSHGIRLLRTDAYYLLNQDEMLIATAEQHETVFAHEPVGAVLHRVVANSSVMCCLLYDAYHGNQGLPLEVRDWLCRHSLHLVSGGGVELIRVLAYYDRDSCDEVSTMVGKRLHNRERSKTSSTHKLRFRDVVEGARYGEKAEGAHRAR